ncbi:AAA family ATPase [Rhodanobacter sp. ANJX3]|uniref:ATP-dependent nuclease n=1 Tax=Rhodanobacter sp. ANJX3 TaxID=2723083 RepID=UPI002104188F|nr:AAA family ATPase [Rhodanobacter sp. ANJX3]
MNDLSKALLRSIKLTKGALRGINSLSLSFDYPIVAFSGVNGAGKSTILAMACCAFHNKLDGYKLPKRKNSYYTFSDFFIQHTNEVTPQGIEIFYSIAHDGWKESKNLPNGKGIGFQARRKKKGGKWNDYDERIDRNVVFLGIERIVPHIERSQSKSYSRSFSAVPAKGWESKVKDIVGFILGKQYDNFRYLEHARYSLPLVQCGTVIYSGFNMGAGENALFEIFSTLYSAGKGALLVMDEIELGLHAKAQKLFMKKLKEVCKEMSTQVICTTHSKEIFECLPDEARFFVEAVGGKTKITAGISPEFAFNKMGASGQKELDIFVEDDVAKSVLQAILPASIRSRTDITIIGSSSAISRQLAAFHVRGAVTQILAVYDGDQRVNEAANLDHAKKMAENPTPTFANWFSSSSTYLPGDTWPEAWILQKCKGVPNLIAESLLIEIDEVADVIEYGLQAGKHNEFHEIAMHVGLTKDQCLQKLSEVVSKAFSNDFDDLRTVIVSKLE